MSLIDDILRNAVAAKASDIHINVGAPPLYRIHTVMSASDFPLVTPEGALRMLKELVSEKRFAEFEETRDADFSYEIPGLGRFRVNAHYQRNTVALAFRAINDKIRPIEQLFLPEVVSKLTYLPRGLILVTGPTGSGKSTTLAAMVDAVNRREQGHIITLEDPIEYAFVSNRCAIEQREVGSDVRRSPAAFVTCCDRTPIRSWWAKCATWRRPARPSPRPRPATWSSARCTRSTRRRRSSASSTSIPATSRTRSARCWPTRCRRSSARRCSNGPTNRE
jgi:twitching motility protein PilT